MSERKHLMSIEYISDDDCGMYRIGEIDCLPDQMVMEHIKRFGEFGYAELRDFFIRGICISEQMIISERNKEHMAQQCDSEKILR